MIITCISFWQFFLKSHFTATALERLILALDENITEHNVCYRDTVPVRYLTSYNFTSHKNKKDLFKYRYGTCQWRYRDESKIKIVK